MVMRVLLARNILPGRVLLLYLVFQLLGKGEVNKGLRQQNRTSVWKSVDNVLVDILYLFLLL